MYIIIAFSNDGVKNDNDNDSVDAESSDCQTIVLLLTIINDSFNSVHSL